jgi:hypothetical protein
VFKKPGAAPIVTARATGTASGIWFNWLEESSLIFLEPNETSLVYYIVLAERNLIGLSNVSIISAFAFTIMGAGGRLFGSSSVGGPHKLFQPDRTG